MHPWVCSDPRQLEELLRFIRDGDTLGVHSMDRLARNLDDLRSLVQKLTRKGVRIRPWQT